MVYATTGAAFTGTVTVYITGDAGTQALGSVAAGVCTHEGNGYHTYAPAQSETDYALIAFTFIGTDAVPVTIQVETVNPALGIGTQASLTFQGTILESIGDFLGYGRLPYVWSREQRAQVTRIVRSAEQRFYNPPGYSWRFLRLRLTLTVDADDGDIDLPTNFGGFLGPYLTFTSADNRQWPIQEVSVSQLLRYRQNPTFFPSSQECVYAVESQTPTGDAQQLSQILLFPTPAADGTLTGDYFIAAEAMTDALPYAMGGPIHSETLLACCKAGAELDRDKKPGPLEALYQERLAASLSHDRRTGPKHLGYNGDSSGYGDLSLAEMRESSFTRNGSDLSGW